MGAFFIHENHPHSPFLSEGGKLRLGKKSDLLGVLTKNMQDEPAAALDVKVLDGAAVVHLLPITNVTTFDEYASDVFVPHLMTQLNTCTRVDVVWDIYKLLAT